MDGEAEACAVLAVVDHVEHLAPVGLVKPLHPGDSGAKLPRRRARPDPVQDRLTDRLDHQAGAKRARCIELIEDRHLMPGVMQKRRGGQPADPGADDRGPQPAYLSFGTPPGSAVSGTTP